MVRHQLYQFGVHKLTSNTLRVRRIDFRFRNLSKCVNAAFSSLGLGILLCDYLRTATTSADDRSLNGGLYHHLAL